jgi:hypothetical protein
MGRPWVGMTMKLGGDNHIQSIHNCYIINNFDIRRLIQVIGALRSVIVNGGIVHCCVFYIITVEIVADTLK